MDTAPVVSTSDDGRADNTPAASHSEPALTATTTARETAAASAEAPANTASEADTPVSINDAPTERHPVDAGAVDMESPGAEEAMPSQKKSPASDERSLFSEALFATMQQGAPSENDAVAPKDALDEVDTLKAETADDKPIVDNLAVVNVRSLGPVGRLFARIMLRLDFMMDDLLKRQSPAKVLLLFLSLIFFFGSVVAISLGLNIAQQLTINRERRDRADAGTNYQALIAKIQEDNARKVSPPTPHEREMIEYGRCLDDFASHYRRPKTIADRLGVCRSQVQWWNDNPGFPRPLTE